MKLHLYQSQGIIEDRHVSLEELALYKPRKNAQLPLGCLQRLTAFDSLGPLQVSGDPEFGTVPEAFLHAEDGGQQAKVPSGGLMASGGRGGAALQ